MKSAFVALIKKNSEVPSNTLIFVAELINSTLHELHAKTSSICKIAFDPSFTRNGSHICYIIKSSIVLLTKYNYSIVNARNCVKDTTLTTRCFCLFYFDWSYYNRYIVRYLQIKSSLVLIANYSII